MTVMDGVTRQRASRINPVDEMRREEGRVGGGERTD